MILPYNKYKIIFINLFREIVARNLLRSHKGLLDGYPPVNFILAWHTHGYLGFRKATNRSVSLVTYVGRH